MNKPCPDCGEVSTIKGVDYLPCGARGTLWSKVINWIRKTLIEEIHF